MQNIAVVVLDTLRKDLFDDQFNWLPGTRFDRAYATSHWTVPVHASLFTGKPPRSAGVYARSTGLNTDEPVLSERLRDEGYSTYAFSANPHIAPGFNFDRGFDTFEQNWKSKRLEANAFRWGNYIQQSQNSSPIAAIKAVAECVRGDYEFGTSVRQQIQMLRRRHVIGSKYADDGARQILEWIQTQDFDGDNFLFLNLMECHIPYNPPEEYQSIEYPREGYTHSSESKYPYIDGKPSSETTETLRTAYEDSVRYLTDVYRRIFEALDDFEYIITVSDHGELFGEHGVWEHSYGVYPELTHVPLVLSGPDRTTEQSDRVVSLADVYGTVLEIAGVNSENHERTGSDDPTEVSLLGDTERPCYAEYHGITYDERISSMKDAGVDPRTIDKMDEPLYGIACAPTYYGYETHEKYASSGRARDIDPEGRLQGYRAGRGSLDSTRSQDLADGVKDHLSDLGYM